MPSLDSPIHVDKLSHSNFRSVYSRFSRSQVPLLLKPPATRDFHRNLILKPGRNHFETSLKPVWNPRKQHVESELHPHYITSPWNEITYWLNHHVVTLHNLAIGSFHGKTLYKCWTMPVSSWEYQPEITRNDELSSWPTSLPGFPS